MDELIDSCPNSTNLCRIANCLCPTEFNFIAEHGTTLGTVIPLVFRRERLVLAVCFLVSQGGSAMPRTKVEPIPKASRLRNWKVVKKLGSGSFGAVYRVVHAHTKEQCAMKVESAEEESSALRLEVSWVSSFQLDGSW